MDRGSPPPTASTQPLKPKVMFSPVLSADSCGQDWARQTGHIRKMVAYYSSRLLSSAWAMLVWYCFISGSVEDQRDTARARGRLLECMTVPRCVLVWLIRC